MPRRVEAGGAEPIHLVRSRQLPEGWETWKGNLAAIEVAELLPDDGKPGTIRFFWRISNDKRASRDRWCSWREADFPLLIRTSKSHGILPIAIYGCCSAVGSALEMRKVIMIPLGRLRTSVSM